MILNFVSIRLSQGQIKNEIMKKIILISFVVAIASVNGNAQEQKVPRKTPEQRTERITVKLNEELALNDAQKVKVKEVILKQEQQREELFKQLESSREVFKEANKKNMQTTENELKTVLTPEQMGKLKQLREDMKQKRQKRGMQHSLPDKEPK